jgi:hypothetical protein
MGWPIGRIAPAGIIANHHVRDRRHNNSMFRK